MKENLDKRYDFRCSKKHLDHKEKDTAKLLRFTMLNQDIIRNILNILKKNGIKINE